MRFYTLIILSIISKTLYSQEYNIDSLFKIFKKDIEIEQFYHGRVVWDNDTKENYYILMNHTPVDTLVKFINDSNPAIRCILFTSLINKKADQKLINEIAQNYINDTAHFTQGSTDLVITWTVNEYMVSFKESKVDEEIDYTERITEIRKTPRVINFLGRHGIIKKNDLLRADSLICGVNEYKIISFTMSFCKNSKCHELKSNSNIITPAMKRRIKKLNSRDQIYIGDIAVLFKDGTTRRMGSQIIRIE